MASNRRLMPLLSKRKVRNAATRTRQKQSAVPRVRRRDRFKVKAEEEQKVEEEVVDKTPPMPEGIERALRAMGSLVKHLRSKQTGPVTVNVELLEINGEYEWALQVRGIKPPARWEGFRTLWNNQCKPVWSSDW